MVLSLARGSEPGRGIGSGFVRAGSGGWPEVYLVAEGFEFGDEAAGLAVGVEGRVK